MVGLFNVLDIWIDDSWLGQISYNIFSPNLFLNLSTFLIRLSHMAVKCAYFFMLSFETR
jgi:hypothetical protein